MKKILAIASMLFVLVGCSFAERVIEVGEGAVATEAVSIKPETKVTIDKGVSIELKMPNGLARIDPINLKGILEVKDGAVKFLPDAKLDVATGAFKVLEGLRVDLHIASDAVHVVFPPIVIPPEAIKIVVQPKMDTQVEKGAFDFKWLGISAIVISILVIIAIALSHFINSRRMTRIENRAFAQK